MRPPKAVAKPTPKRPRRRVRRSKRAWSWALVLGMTLGATATAVLLMGVFLLRTVNSFDGDEVRELTAMAGAMAAVVAPALTFALKIWERVNAQS